MTIELIPLVVIPSLLLSFAYLIVLRYIGKHFFKAQPHSPGNSQGRDEASER